MAFSVSDIREMIQARDQLRTWVQEHWQYVRSDYFYTERFVKALVTTQELAGLPKNSFLDYNAYRRYYHGRHRITKLVSAGKSRQLVLPYEQVIDLSRQPATRIVGPGTLPNFDPSDEWYKLTQSNLDAFLERKPSTTNGPVVRVADLRFLDVHSYSLSLERAGYFDQVRTNLTLDYQEHAGRESLRIKDLSPDEGLPSFAQSSLANTIGVSAVVFFQKAGEDFVFMKLRRPHLGVYENMFGTVSGAAQAGANQRIADVIQWAQGEMLREFRRETGIDHDADEQEVKWVIPLAFTRDLVRGGKPQFFFAIQIAPQSENLFRKKFRPSAEGLDEFCDSLISNKTSLGRTLSPEFLYNLILFFEWRSRSISGELYLDSQ